MEQVSIDPEQGRCFFSCPQEPDAGCFLTNYLRKKEFDYGEIKVVPENNWNTDHISLFYYCDVIQKNNGDNPHMVY